MGQTKHIVNCLGLAKYVPSAAHSFCDFFSVYFTRGNRIILACIMYLLGGFLPLKFNDPCRFLRVTTSMLLIRMFLKIASPLLKCQVKVKKNKLILVHLINCMTFSHHYIDHYDLLFSLSVSPSTALGIFNEMTIRNLFKIHSIQFFQRKKGTFMFKHFLLKITHFPISPLKILSVLMKICRYVLLLSSLLLLCICIFLFTFLLIAFKTRALICKGR